MSSTRRAAPGGELAAEKFASSAEFERGIVGSLVARRCTVLEAPKNKELIWFIHFLSHQPGGLKALAAALPENYPEHFGTSEMVKLAKRSGQNYSAEQVQTIRRELPACDQREFLLRGETLADVDRDAANALRMERKDASARANLLDRDARDECASDAKCDELRRQAMAPFERKEAELKAAAEKNPANYSVADFLAVCQSAAADDLEESIRRLCLNPACDPENFAPWYFAGLVAALRNYFEHWVAERGEGLVVTEIGREIIETLEYTAYSRKLTLIEGGARIGKSFSAKAWCELHPGQARFIEVPTGNDETSFFRALARGLGIGNFAQYKAIEIRERVESVLLTGDLLVCLDEAWRLWPQQTEQRYGFPKRITWVMSMANQGVPICLISTPQFLSILKAKEETISWNSAQFQGRLGQYKPLPAELSREDLIEVASALLPEADNVTLRNIANYARSSLRYLAAIETISTRARYLASRAGRDAVEADDVRRAMQESVIPSDSQLVRALESKRPNSRRQMAPAPAARSDDAAGLPPISSVKVPVPPRAGRAAETQTEAPGSRAQSLIHTLPEL
jgi:hypothetical protein